MRFETTVRELERTLLVRTNGNESLRNARTGNVYASRRGHENKRTVREVSASWKAKRKGKKKERKAEKQNEENENKFEWTRRQRHKAEIKTNTIKYNKM